MDNVEAIIAIAQQCICSTFTDLCECCGHSGVALPPAADCCECEEGKTGRAYIQVERIYPAGSPFPAMARGAAKCGGSRMAVEFSVTVYRCVATIDGSNGHPDCDTTTAEMNRNIRDMATVREALLCCMKDEVHHNSSFQIALLEQTPLNPEGGCGGTTTKAVATADNFIQQSDILTVL
jgi:hypothetical protein